MAHVGCACTVQLMYWSGRGERAVMHSVPLGEGCKVSETDTDSFPLSPCQPGCSSQLAGGKMQGWGTEALLTQVSDSPGTGMAQHSGRAGEFRPRLEWCPESGGE